MVSGEFLVYVYKFCNIDQVQFVQYSYKLSPSCLILDSDACTSQW